MKPTAGPWALAAIVAGGLGYAVLSHELMLHAAAQGWAVLVLLGPLLAAGAALAWRARNWALLAVAAATAVFLAWLVARDAEATVDLLYMLQHTGFYLVLGISFALTLGQPRSMIGRVAERVHALTPDMVVYTRHVTLTWTIYFFSMSALSVLVYVMGSWEAWSLLANVLTPISVGLLFVGEYVVRYRIHPEFERVTLRDTVGAWRKHELTTGPGES